MFYVSLPCCAITVALAAAQSSHPEANQTERDICPVFDRSALGAAIDQKPPALVEMYADHELIDADNEDALWRCKDNLRW